MSNDLSAIKKRAAARWLNLPGVNAVGIGSKECDGRMIGKLAIKVYVTEKKPLDSIPPAEVIPADVEGVPTDVVVMGPVPRNLSRPVGFDLFREEELVHDRKRYRPLTGGSQIQAKLGRAGFGTLGCFLRDPSDLSKVYALTNHHVFAEHTRGLSVAAKVGQPTKKDSMTKCCSHIFGNYAAPDPAHRPMADDLETVLPNPTFTLDAAIARLEAGTCWTPDILEIGPPKGVHTVTQSECENIFSVCKRGSASGLTGGTVNCVETQCKDTTAEVMLIDARADPDSAPVDGFPQVFALSSAGDSGSAVLDHQGRVVGLLTGECRTELFPHLPAATKAIVLPIAEVLNEFLVKEGLTLEVVTESRPGVEHKVPSASGRRAAESSGRTLSIPATAVRSTNDPGPELSPGLTNLERDLDESGRGRGIIAIWIEHQEELNALVNNKRPVTVAWHRNGGPELVQSLMRAVEIPGHAVPDQLAGRSLPDALYAIRDAFVAHGSPQLGVAFEELEEALPEIRSMTYQEFLVDVQDETPGTPVQQLSKDGPEQRQPRV